MQTFYMTQIRDVCRLEAELRIINREVKKALGELMLNGVICSYWISKPKKGEIEKRVLRIWKKNAPSASEPVPTARGEFASIASFQEALSGKESE